MKVELKLGGSDRGYSWYTKVLRCPRRVWYSEQRGTRANIGRGKAETGKLLSTLVGTMFHHHMEAFYSGGESGLVFTHQGVDLVGYEAEAQEAARLADAYRKVYQPGEFVFPLIEVDLRDESGAMDVPLLTGRVDLAVAWSGGPLPGSSLYLRAGRYIVDHKTASGSSSTLDKDYEIQLWVYQYLWNQQHPNDPCLAAIVNEVVKTKNPKFRRVLVPPPTESQIAAIKETLTYAWSVWQSKPELRIVSDDTCIDNWGVCPFREACLKK